MDAYPRTTPDEIQYDDVLIGRNATNAGDRRDVLSQSVELIWAADDIGKIERFEPIGGRFFLAMWRYRAGNTY